MAMLRQRGQCKRRRTSNATGVVGDENYHDSYNAESPSSESESERDGRKGRRRLNQRGKRLDIQDTKAVVIDLVQKY